MASAGRVRTRRGAGARYSKNTVGRTRSTGGKAGQPHKLTDVYDFSENSGISSMGRMSENEKDEEPYESFEPPLHSTAIYSDEAELSQHCGSFIPSPPRGQEARRSSNASETEDSENEPVKVSAKKRGRKLKPISDESESCNERDKPEKIASQRPEAVSSSELSEKSAELGTSEKKTQKKKVYRGKRKKSRSEAMDSGMSDRAQIWCLQGKQSSDIMDLDVVLSAFEETLPEYKQNIESKICQEAVGKFHSSMKEELIRMTISDIERKRQRLVEVQDELLCLEPQLKQLQTKYDELKERKSSLKDAACFLSNLKQLHQDYSDIQERQPNVKETYDSSSLPALLFKERTLLGAESHLQNINHQLEKLLAQK
ncbi:centromere protein U isoform X2 [Myotis daubentonii]|uniref:centromere protein U isoform X2 n=1 Tax=Myotis daubentonii TaxID=98922 RepID=UPI0028735C87|nr:centromere protein U isoform X2 [Myotis daubentonii]